MDSVRTGFVLETEETLFHFVVAQALPSEEGTCGEEQPVTGVHTAERVLHVGLRGEIEHREGAVRLGGGRGEGGVARDEEMESGEGRQVGHQFAQVAVERAREAEARAESSERLAGELVEVAVAGGGDAETPLADAKERGVIVKRDKLRTAVELLERENRIVGLDDDIGGGGGGGQDGGSGDDFVGVVLREVPQKERAEARAGASPERVEQLERMQVVALFGLVADHIQGVLQDIKALSVEASAVEIGCALVATHEAVRREGAAEATCFDLVENPCFEIHQHSPRRVASLPFFREEDVGVAELQLSGALCCPVPERARDPVYSLPEGKVELVATGPPEASLLL